MSTPNHTILDAFRNRLLSAISRSPLLKVSIATTGRLLDCSRLDTLQTNLGKQVLKAVIGNEPPIPIDLPWRLVLPSETTDAESEEQPEFSSDKERRAQRSAREQKLLEQMLIRISRYGALAKRETGIHAIWLGYPLLYVAIAETEPLQQLLAPVFLWPIAIEPDRRHQGRYIVGRNKVVGPPQFNRAMAAWIKNKLQFDVSAPSEDEMTTFAWDNLPEQLERLANGFPCPPVVNCEDALEAIPKLTALDPQQSPRFFNSAVVGYIRWQNAEILADLDAIKGMTECEAPVAGFITGAPLEKPAGNISTPPEEDRFQVCDADFSQERVVWKSRAKPGLVVHGPPGTGKSQTIVNIIADALAHDRTVIMVCQKQAATRVVLERLRKVGLADLCMEVHDPESERVSVFTAIREQAQRLPNAVRATTTLVRRQQLAGEIATVKNELDGIAKSLHELHPIIGLPFRKIKAREGRIHHAYPSVRSLPFLQNILRGMSAQALDEMCPRVKNVGRWFKEADPQNNPWRDHQPDLQVNPITESDVQAILTQLRELDARHQEQIERHGAGQPLPPNVTEFVDTAQQFMTKLLDLVNNPQLPRSVLTLRWLKVIRRIDSSQLQEHFHRCEDAVAMSAKVAESLLDPAWDQVCSRLSEEQLEHLRLQAKCVLKNEGRWWRFFNPFYHASGRAIRRMRTEGGGKTIWEAAADLLACMKARELREQLAGLNRSLVPGIDPHLPDARTHTRYPQIALQSLEAADWLCKQERKYDLLTRLLDKFLVHDQQGSLDNEIQSLEQSIQRSNVANSLINDLTRLGIFLRQEALKQTRDDVLAGKSIQSWLDGLSAGFKGLPSLLRWEIDCRQRQAPHRAILECLEEGYEQGRTSGQILPSPPNNSPDENYGEWWWALVEFTAVTTWLTACYEIHPELLLFDPEQHEQKRKHLGKLLQQKRTLEAETIGERWQAEQVGVRSGPWNQLFQLRGANAKRLRQAVEMSLPRGLLKLRPCWLVDPGTAAQIFPLKPGLFDLVIFDEASQCPIEYAVPAIYRGKTLIVSGDSKQLPPTSFFATRVQADLAEEEDEEDKEASDQAVSTENLQLRQINAEYLMTVEDLLEASIGNLPEERLLVHYRSDHPRLIDFSNRAFYYGQLECPPARMDALNGKPPIQYHHVNGLYEKRTNRDEARKVVELLKDAWRPEVTPPTIGVVTFNLPQRDLIEDLLEKECQVDEVFAARYQQELSRKEENQDVGFFVKNLENVQGDERDMMIFSTTFGRNANGSFYRRFGPVGAERGERRLNVAITRAKHQIVIVGSMPIEEISETLGAAAAPGMNLKPRCYLQLYLAYARAVSAGDEEQVKRILDRLSHAGVTLQTQEGPESPLEEEVLHELHKLGHSVDCQVGESGFRIDLAVRHSNQGYLLGIECDGATYHSDRAAHLRDVWRETILRNRGWKLHRIWSTRWWHHRAEEIDKLKDAIFSAHAPEKPQAESAPLSDVLNFDPLPDRDVSIPEVVSAPQQSRLPWANPPTDSHATTLDENKRLIAFYAEFKVKWEEVLEKVGLPKNAFAMGVRRDMTLAEARKIVNNMRGLT